MHRLTWLFEMGMLLVLCIVAYVEGLFSNTTTAASQEPSAADALPRPRSLR